MNDFLSLAWDRLAQLAFTALVTKIPILGFGPFGVIVKYIINKFADELYFALKEKIAIDKIEMQNDELNAEFKNSSAKLKLIGLKYGLDSKEYADAIQIFKTNLDRLISF